MISFQKVLFQFWNPSVRWVSFSFLPFFFRRWRCSIANRCNKQSTKRSLLSPNSSTKETDWWCSWKRRNGSAKIFFSASKRNPWIKTTYRYVCALISIYQVYTYMYRYDYLSNMIKPEYLIKILGTPGKYIYHATFVHLFYIFDNNNAPEILITIIIFFLM